MKIIKLCNNGSIVLAAIIIGVVTTLYDRLEAEGDEFKQERTAVLQ